jgi:hypothetical protein
MPAFAVNCSAANPFAPQQHVALNTASSGHDDPARFVISLQPRLGNASSRAREFAVTRSAPAPLLFALGAATLLVALVTRIMATVFGRRSIGRSCLGARSCRP